MAGPNGAHGSGPLTGRVYACEQHAEEIHREDTACPFLPRGVAVADVLCTSGLLAVLALSAVPEIFR